MNKKIKIVLGYIILFIESLLLCFICLLFIASKTFFNKDYVTNKVQEADFYNIMFNSIKTEMSYYTEQSGFEDDILDDTFTLEEVKIESDKFINAIYTGSKIEVDSSMFQKRLNDKISDYIAKSNFKVINEEEINKFVEKLAEIYENKIKVNTYIDHVGSIVKNTSQKVNKILIISVVSLLILIAINKFVFNRTELAILFFFTAFILISINLYIHDVIDIKHLFVYNDAITSVVKLIVDEIFSNMTKIAIISIPIGIVLSILKKEEKN